MKLGPGSLMRRLACAGLAGLVFLVAFWGFGRLEQSADQFRARERLVADLNVQIDLLNEQRREIDLEHERILNVAHDWLGKATIPLATILENARLNAIQGSGFELDKCYAHATLESQWVERGLWVRRLLDRAEIHPLRDRPTDR